MRRCATPAVSATPSKCVAMSAGAPRALSASANAISSARPSRGPVVRANSSIRISVRGDARASASRPRTISAAYDESNRVRSCAPSPPIQTIVSSSGRTRFTRRRRNAQRRARAQESGRRERGALSAHVRSGEHRDAGQIERHAACSGGRVRRSASANGANVASANATPPRAERRHADAPPLRERDAREPVVERAQRVRRVARRVRLRAATRSASTRRASSSASASAREARRRARAELSSNAAVR